MTTINPKFRFKGDPFKSRYRITGILEGKSPIHIGTGENRPEESPLLKESETQEAHHIDEIARDVNGLPYLPGSTIRGVVRNYLWQIFYDGVNDLAGNTMKIANEPNYDDPAFKKWVQRKYPNEKTYQDQLKKYMKQDASLFEQVFGTPFCEGKVEFWDAELLNTIKASALSNKGWDDERQSYVVRSVSIDPLTGAAEPNKLYAFDVVPPGAKFEVNLTGQNLNEVELGFVLFGLYGFNSDIFPLTIGAMSGRGFGRMTFRVTKIYRLDHQNIDVWKQEALTHDHAGYGSLPELGDGEAKDALEVFKRAFQKVLPGDKP